MAARSPVKMGSAAIVGNQRITVATLNTEVTNLSQSAKQYPGMVSLTATEETQATLTWLIRYQINEEVARQAGITVSTAQAEAGAGPGLRDGEDRGRGAGPDQRHPEPHPGRQRDPAEHLPELGRYEAITNRT